MPSRRTILRGIGALGVGGYALRGATPDPWARATCISARVRGPRFPNRWFDITRFGVTASRSVVEHVDDLVLTNVLENGAEMEV